MPVRRPQRFTAHPGRGALAAERFCARCGARDVRLEKHHWAPRAVFEDADSWPLSLLCEPCHDDWHRKMGWQPRVMRARRREQDVLTELDAIIENVQYFAQGARDAGIGYGVYASVGQMLGYFSGDDARIPDVRKVSEGMQEGEVVEAKRTLREWHMSMVGNLVEVGEETERIRRRVAELQELRLTKKSGAAR